MIAVCRKFSRNKVTSVLLMLPFSVNDLFGESMKGVPSANVGVKISEWYDAVNKFDVKTAIKLKRQVEELLEQMEEDQNVLIYYQLMKFRHDLTMNYLFPSEASKPLEKWEYLKKSEGRVRN